VAEIINAKSLYRLTLYPSEIARGSFSRTDLRIWPNGEFMTLLSTHNPKEQPSRDALYTILTPGEVEL
jgi:hypothetical protein